MGKFPWKNEQYATYEYDSLGRVSVIHSYTSGGEETGYCIITYSSGDSGMHAEYMNFLLEPLMWQ